MSDRHRHSKRRQDILMKKQRRISDRHSKRRQEILMKKRRALSKRINIDEFFSKKYLQNSSQKRRIIQKTPSLRLNLYNEIDNFLNKYFTNNIQCLDKCDPVSRKKNGGYCLRDFFIKIKQIGTRSAYGKVFVSCINADLIFKDYPTQCLTICSVLEYYKDLPPRLIDECKGEYKHEPLLIALKLQALNEIEVSDIQYCQSHTKTKNYTPWNVRRFCKTEMWREIRATQLLSLLIKYGICPNVPIIYRVYLCDKCTEQAGELTLFPSKSLKIEKVKCLIIVNELSNGDFKTWMKSKRSENEWFMAYFQIFMGVLAMQLNFGMVHYDFHWGNQLWSIVNQEYWQYNLYSYNNIFLKSFIVPTMGSLFKIWDLGKVKSDVGLGEDYTTHRKIEAVNGIPVPQYFNDVVLILRAALEWSGSNETVEAPPVIKKWANYSMRYIYDRMKNGEGNIPDDFASVIIKIFKPNSLKVSGYKGSLDLSPNQKVNVTQEWDIRRSATIVKLADTFDA